MRKAQGHFWTVWPLVRGRLQGPPALPPAEPWSHRFEDPDVGPVRLSGRLGARPEQRRLVVVIHGIGGSIDGGYMARSAADADALGLASLRLNLRGADLSGNDFYHAGLSSDLAEVLRSPALARFRRIDLLGFSLGGHLCLRFATEARDPRLGAVAAICPPIDLERTVTSFDRPVCWAYRRFVLANLVRMSEALAARGAMPTPIARLRRVRTIREWDRLTVVPRFGFASPEDYYRRAGVAGRLDRLRCPALVVAAEHDPIVPGAAVRAGIRGAGDHLRVEWPRRGGHLGFPGDLDLGLSRPGRAGPRGVIGQAMAWLHGQT